MGAKRVNELCEELGIAPQNPGISTTPIYENKEKTSKYKGVSYDKQTGKWDVRVYSKGQKRKSGGRFNDELDAAKRVNQLCEELGIPLQNPGIRATPNEPYQKKEKISKYEGVTGHKEIEYLYVQLLVKEEKKNNTEYFNNEPDEGNEANQLCGESGILPQNPKISPVPNQQHRTKEKTSQYKGVSYDKRIGKWIAAVSLKGENKQKYGGRFDDELDAAKRVNELCEVFGIPEQNPEVRGILNLNKKRKTSQYAGVYWHRQIGHWYTVLHQKDKNERMVACLKMNWMQPRE